MKWQWVTKAIMRGLVKCKSDHSYYSHHAPLTASQRLQAQKECSQRNSALEPKGSLGDEHCIVKRKTLSQKQRNER